MTALADQLTAMGYFDTSAIADLAITAGEVYRDSASAVRVAGSPRAIYANPAAAGQVSGLTLVDGGNTLIRGTGTAKW